MKMAAICASLLLMIGLMEGQTTKPEKPWRTWTNQKGEFCGQYQMGNIICVTEVKPKAPHTGTEMKDGNACDGSTLGYADSNGNSFSCVNGKWIDNNQKPKAPPATTPKFNRLVNSNQPQTNDYPPTGKLMNFPSPESDKFMADWINSHCTAELAPAIKGGEPVQDFTYPETPMSFGCMDHGKHVTCPKPAVKLAIHCTAESHK